MTAPVPTERDRDLVNLIAVMDQIENPADRKEWLLKKLATHASAAREEALGEAARIACTFARRDGIGYRVADAIRSLGRDGK